MSLRWMGADAPYEKERTERELQDLIVKEARAHTHLRQQSSSMSLCSCGQVFNGPDSWRHELHVSEVKRVTEEKLRGSHHE